MTSNLVTCWLDKQKLEQNYASYCALGSVFFPLKANASPFVLGVLAQNLKQHPSNGFLISCKWHYELLAKLGVNVESIALMNVLASKQTIGFLVQKGITKFAFDETNKLKWFLSAFYGKKFEIALRISIAEAFNVESHLGASIDQAKQMLTLLKGTSHRIGLSFYLNSDVSTLPDALQKMVAFLCEHFASYEIQFVSVGGIKGAESVDASALKMCKKTLKLEQIVLEPGGFLVGDAVTLQTKIIKTGVSLQTHYAVIANGLYSGFFDKVLLNKEFCFALKQGDDTIVLQKHATNADDVLIKLFGGSSDSADKLGQYYLPKSKMHLVQVGEALFVKNVGGYFDVLYMSYCSDLEFEYKLAGESYEV